MRLLIACCIILAGMSGCTGGGGGIGALSECAPPVSARLAEVQEEVPEYDLPMTIRVVTDDRALHRATVVVQWATFAEEDTARAADQPVRYIARSTDINGLVQVTVPDDVYLIVSASYPGLTEEWTPIMEPGNITSDIVIPLYPTYIAMDFEGSFNGVVTANDPVRDRWHAHDATPDGNPDLMRRVFGVTATLTWKQSEEQVIDMDLGMGRDPDSVNYTFGSGHTAAAGDPTILRQTWTVGEVTAWDALWVGPYAENGHVLQTPVDYELLVELDVQRGDRAARACVLYGSLEVEQQFPDAATQGLNGVPVAVPVTVGLLSGLLGILVGAGAVIFLRRR